MRTRVISIAEFQVETRKGGDAITEFNNTLAREDAEDKTAELIHLADNMPVFKETRRSEIMQ